MLTMRRADDCAECKDKDVTAVATLRRHSRTAALIALLALAGCTGSGQSLQLGDAPGQLVSEQEITQMSDQTWTRIKQEEKRAPEEVQQRIDRIAQRVVKAAGVADRTWDVVVFESDQVNAFALPGGHIGVYQGLIDLAENDAQLAAVIAHEVGHVTHNHSQERVGATKAANLGINAVNAALQAGNVQFANQIAAVLGAGAKYGVVLPYGRAQELEADEVGLMTMARAGYDPRQAIAFWQLMQQQKGGGAPPEFLSTHPADQTRIDELKAMLPQAMELYRQNEA